MLALCFFLTRIFCLLLQRKKEKKRLEKESAVKDGSAVSLFLSLLCVHASLWVENPDRKVILKLLWLFVMLFMLFQEEEQGKSDSSEKEDDETIIESNAETTGSSRSDKTQKATEAARCDKTGADTAEKNLVKMNENEEEEQKVCQSCKFQFFGTERQTFLLSGRALTVSDYMQICNTIFHKSTFRMIIPKTTTLFYPP